jgi:hypothetical protein
MEKMLSKMTLPPISPGIERPRMVMTGRSAFLSACFLMTMLPGSPLAYAVVMYSCLRTSRRLFFM